MGSKIGRKHFVTTRIDTPAISFGTITSSSIVINWTAETGATTYTVQRAGDPSFSVALTTVYTGNLLTFTDSVGLTQNTTYYYRIKATGVGYVDSFYATDNATTLVESGGATNQLQTPVIGRLGLGTTSVTITWGSISGADLYQVQRATNSSFTTGLTTLYAGAASGVTRSFQPGYMLEYNDSGLTAGTTYYYRVKAFDSTETYLDSAYATKTIALPSANKTASMSGSGVASGVEGASNYWSWWNGSQTVPIYAGDTVTVNGSSIAYIVLQNFHGTPSQPLIIRNNGDVIMSAGFSLESCSHIQITGSHSSKTLPQGIHINGSGDGTCVEINGFSHHIEVDNLYTQGSAYFLRCKNEVATFGSLLFDTTSTTNITPATGSKTLTVQSGLSYKQGDLVEVVNDGDNYMVGVVTSYSGTTLVFNCTAFAGTAKSSWAISLAGTESGDCGELYWYPTTIHDIHIHHNHAYNHFQDIIYLGSSSAWNGRSLGCHGSTIFPYPSGLANIEVNDNVLEYAGRSGIQVGHMRQGTNRIHHNTITECGYEYNDQQGAGIAFGSANNSAEIDHNNITRTYREPIYSYHFGELYIHDNITDEAGKISVDSTRDIFWIKYTGTTAMSATVTATNQGKVVKPAGSDFDYEFYYNYGDGPVFKVQKYNPATAQNPRQKIVDAFSTALGAHLGTHADPYVGFGGTGSIALSDVQLMTEIYIPFGMGALMFNPFSNHAFNIYGSPDGLMRVRIENNSFGTQTAASTKVITFNNTTNYYGTGNIICGNTYLGSAITESNITKPGGSVVTYSLASSCIPTSLLVESNETFNTTAGASRGGLKWLPSDYSDPTNSSKNYPIIIFLHGAGEGSNIRNNTLLKNTSLPEVITNNEWEGISQDPVTGIYYQFLIFAPQAPALGSYSGGDLASILTDIMSRFRVDTNRIYVTGLSAGGSGTISVGNQAVLRNNVTAILPICAAGFSHPTHDTDFDNVAGNNIEMCMIVGNDDSWKTFGQGLVTRYNAHSPAPTNAAVQRIIASPAGHDENTWNACFQTTFDVYNGTGTANNIYEWMLKNHK